VPPGKIDNTWMGIEAGFERGWLFFLGGSHIISLRSHSRGSSTYRAGQGNELKGWLT
jgi:hypothetical protein